MEGGVLDLAFFIAVQKQRRGGRETEKERERDRKRRFTNYKEGTQKRNHTY